jgi:hypothetical protein
MIRVAVSPQSVAPQWHEVFLKMAPAVEAHAKIAFRHLRPEARAEAIQSALCAACTAVARLAQLGKLDVCYPTVMARYAVAQVRDGRMLGRSLNCKDVASEYGQRRKAVTMERLDHFDEEENAWQEAVVVDTRSSPVPDIVAFRCDFRQWLASLPRRDRRIAESLAVGNCTGDVAKRFALSAGRISQLRRSLAESWRTFVGDEAQASAASEAA